jgi:type I restriction enzyme S subunit
MWTGRILASELDKAGRWTVSYFSSEAAPQIASYPLVRLRDLTLEVKQSVDPKNLADDYINYIGLENIRSLTGELVSFRKLPRGAVQSRSKVYRENDVLYGRLRPELNKVYIVERDIAPGICSNEFIVLRARDNLIHPRYLRYVLASPYVTRFANKLRTGASLPRMSSADLLDLAVPAPPIARQMELAKMLETADLELRRIRNQVDILPNSIMDALMSTVGDGEDSLTHLVQGITKGT